ncbi:hypothetical protein BaRGS_00038739 [Batillaria attramentaria]|uniref:Uncharacterized protein n=1 Tax=Batillaria attramentaria TaxID=370345 RepID=A0ABD0J5H0_9CAEN
MGEGFVIGMEKPYNPKDSLVYRNSFQTEVIDEEVGGKEYCWKHVLFESSWRDLNSRRSYGQDSALSAVPSRPLVAQTVNLNRLSNTRTNEQTVQEKCTHPFWTHNPCEVMARFIGS